MLLLRDGSHPVGRRVPAICREPSLDFSEESFDRSGFRRVIKIMNQRNERGVAIAVPDILPK